MNKQPIEKQVDEKLLSVHSIFLTIQGEGPFTGDRAVFIRLAGCNLQCPMCDTDYTEGRKEMNTFSILAKVNTLLEKRSLVVITGGEPFRQNIKTLVDGLIHLKYQVQIETNGTLPPHPMMDSRVTVICSPKTGSVNKKLIPFISAYKYVLAHNRIAPDGLPSSVLSHPNIKGVYRPGPASHKKIYLQPEDSGDEFVNSLNLKAVKKSCLKHGYRLQLQVHKLIGMQ